MIINITYGCLVKAKLICCYLLVISELFVSSDSLANAAGEKEKKPERKEQQQQPPIRLNATAQPFVPMNRHLSLIPPRLPQFTTAHRFTFPQRTQQQYHRTQSVVEKPKDRAVVLMKTSSIIAGPSRQAELPSHFISIPLLDPRLRAQYEALVQQICADEKLEKECRNFEIFMRPAKLHLTLGVLKLFTEEDLDKAKQFLDQLFRENGRIRQLLAEGPIRVEFPVPTLSHFAHRTADKVDILFARVASERLQALANAIDDALTKAGLNERRRSPDGVVLHMTVLNTKYLWGKQRGTFLNVKPLLDRYEQFQFDPVNVEEVHLCQMQGTDLNGGYISVHTISFGAGTPDKNNSNSREEEEKKKMINNLYLE